MIVVEWLIKNKEQKQRWLYILLSTIEILFWSCYKIHPQDNFYGRFLNLYITKLCLPRKHPDWPIAGPAIQDSLRAIRYSVVTSIGIIIVMFLYVSHVEVTKYVGLFFTSFGSICWIIRPYETGATIPEQNTDTLILLSILMANLISIFQ